MTISKEKLEQIALDEAQKVAPDGWLCGIDPVIEFAHALIKRVEAEQESVTHTKMDIDKPPIYLIALPLVEE